VVFNGTACVVQVGNGSKTGGSGGTGTSVGGKDGETTVGGSDGETGPKTMLPVIVMSLTRTRDAELKKAGTD
jgi:hypothetical protein